MKKTLSILVALAMLCSGSLTVFAADTWTGASSAVFNASNWSGTNNPPISNDALIFTSVTGGHTSLTNDLTSGAFNVAGITFNSGAAAFTIAGNAFALTGAVANNSTSLQTINDSFSMAALQTFTTTAGGGNITQGGVISGVGGLIKEGAGTLTLAAKNSYTGGTTVNGGTLSLTGSDNSGSSVIGTGTLTINSGAIVSTTGQDNPFGFNASIMHNIAINGGTLSLGSTWATVDHITLTAGGTISGAGNLYMDYMAGQGFTDTITANGVGNVLSMGSLDLHAATTINTAAGADLTISSPINEAAAGETLTKTGAGTLILSNTNTYTGTTTISGGSLQLGNGGTTGSLSTSSAITDNGTLAFNRSNTVTQGVDFASGITGTGGVTQSGSGTLVLGANTYSGTTSISTGKIQFNSSLITSAINFTGAGTAEFGHGTNVSLAITNDTQDQGTVIFDDGSADNHIVSGDIGSTGTGVHEVKVGTWSTTFNGNVKSTLFTLTGNGGNITVADGKSISAPITVNTNGASTINYAGTTTISNDLATAGTRFAYINFNGGTVGLGANIYTDPASQGATGKTTVDNATVNLSGNRTIGGKLVLQNSAILDLGNNTATVTGVYAQGSGTTLKLTANSSSDYGKITTASAAAVNSGSSVYVNVGGYIPNNAVLKVIDSGSTGVGSAPGTVNSSNSKVSFLASILNNDLILTASRAATGYTPIATTTDSKAAATVLDNITNPSSDMTTVLNTLDGLSNAQTAAALNTLVPDISGFNPQVPVTLMEQFVGAQMDHLGGVSRLALDGAAPQTGMSAGDQSSSLSTWYKAFGNYAHQDPRGTSQGYNFSNAGGALGFEKQLSDAFKTGIALGNSQSWVRGKDSTSRTDINATQASLYGGLKPIASPWYLNGSLNYSYSQYGGSREIHISSSDNRIANSDYRGDLYGAALETGYGIKVGKTVFTPLASLAYSHLRVGKYSEADAGALNLDVNTQDYDNLRAGLGGKLESEKEVSFGTLTSDIHAKYLYDVIADRQNMVASFAGGGTAFTTQGYKPVRSGANIGTAITIATKKNVTLSLQYDYEMRQSYYAHTGSLNVAYKF